MGIRGLTGYVEHRQEDCTEKEEDLKKVTLGVDFDSFIHFACDSLAQKYNSKWLILGGDSRALYIWVREWMKPLFSRQIRLIFVRDPPGMLNTIKDVTHGKRTRDKVEKFSIIQNGLFDEKSNDNENIPHRKEDSILELNSEVSKTLLSSQAVFLLARQAVIRCLKHAGCKLITAPTEADETLGDMVRNKSIYAVLARDSDYLMMSNMRYIPLNMLHVDPTTECVHATIFSAIKLADMAAISQEKLVEWSILCGNDFTPYLDVHFDFANKVHLPLLRQTQGFFNVSDALVWIKENIGTSNWLDDPILNSLLKEDGDLLSHVYGIYCFYGVGKLVKSRFPQVKRSLVLPGPEWKKVSRLLDRSMLPFFCIDVMYAQTRTLSMRSQLLRLSCPLFSRARECLYGFLGETEVTEYQMNLEDGRSQATNITTTLHEMQILTMDQHSKSTRAKRAKDSVIAWLHDHPDIQKIISQWTPPKKMDDLKCIGFGMAMLLAMKSDSLTEKSWSVLLLTTILCSILQRETTVLPFPEATVIQKDMVVVANLYLHSMELLIQLYRILGLNKDQNEHAFYSSSMYMYLMGKYPWTKSTLQHVLRDPAIGLNQGQLGVASWTYHVIYQLFAKHLPSNPTPSLTPSVIYSKKPSAVPKKSTKPVDLELNAPENSSRAPLASPQEIDPLEWEDEVVVDTAPPQQPVKDIKELIFSLPVFNHKQEILDYVASNPLVVIQGETGCGKSTSVPQFLLDANAREGNLYVTQPRRVAAITLATTVAKMRGEEIGRTIGYRVGQVQKDSNRTQITYVTTGYMLERLIHNPESIKKVTHVILDEAHERSMDMDMLLLMLSTHWHLWPNLKVIIMSATMDSSIFFKYFKPVLPAPLKQKEELFVGSALHPVKTIYLEDLKKSSDLNPTKLIDSFKKWNKSDMLDIELVIKKLQGLIEPQLDLCMKITKKIVTAQDGKGCILIFVSGINDIQVLHEQLEHWREIQLFVLHSDIDINDQGKAFEHVEGKTKIILSTNIAESSVTIPDVTHIINTGLEKQIVMHTQSHSEVLIRSWCSRASVKQRSGRAGRIRPGIAYHLFTKEFMENCMDEYSTPELLRKPLDKVVLQLKAQMHHIDTPSKLLGKALTPPDLSNIQNAFHSLFQYSALSSPNENDMITSFGTFSVYFPLEIRLCRLLMYGLSVSDWGIGAVDVVLLVAIMASPDLHISPSRFHIKDPEKYMNEMKATLEAKLSLQSGDVWSEPLGIWQLLLECLQASHKGQVSGLLRRYSISIRRFQTMLVLVGEICGRLMRIARLPQYQNTCALNSEVISQLNELQKFSARMYSPNKWNYKHTTRPQLRLLLVLNFTDCLVRGRLADGPSKKSKEAKIFKASLSLDFDNTCAAWGSHIPGIELQRILGIALAPNSIPNGSPTSKSTKEEKEADEIVVTKTPKGINAKFNSTDEMPFGISLLFYLRERRFPVDISMRELWEGEPSTLRLRFTDRSLDNGSPIHWTQSSSGSKINLSGRSVFGLPVSKLDKKVVSAIVAEQLLTGDGSTIVGGCCTLIPPEISSYLAIVMLICSKQNVWLYMDKSRMYWKEAKIDGHTFIVDEWVNLQPTLNIINKIRQELSRGLVKSLPTNDERNETVSNDEIKELFQTHKKKLKDPKWIQFQFDLSEKVPFPPLILE